MYHVPTCILYSVRGFLEANLKQGGSDLEGGKFVSMKADWEKTSDC